MTHAAPSATQPIDRSALIPAFSCYILWGFFPLYWKLLAHIEVMENLMHRIIWSFVFYVAIMAVRAAIGRQFSYPVTRRDWLIAAIAGVLMSANWGIYIYAVNNHHIVEGSLAYFINPLLSVAVGVVIFREPFPVLLKLAFVLALIGVGIQIFYGDHFPWIALSLATSFCIYGALKKVVKVNPTQFSMMETSFVLLPALLMALMLRSESSYALTGVDWLLFIGGGVTTGIPLLLFAFAAQRLPYSLMGMLQFIGPTIQFSLGVWLFGEEMSAVKWWSFAFIWAGVAVYLADRIRVARNLRKASRVPLATPQAPE